MEVYKAILKRRSIRSFQQRRIPIKVLRRMINTARLAPSAANMQPLEFLVVIAKTLCDELLKQLKWAGYITPAGNPKPGCEPTAYILILINKHKVSHPLMKGDEKAIRYSFTPDLRDVGAASENIMLFAQSRGIASCWLSAINRPGIRKIFSIPKWLTIDSAIALGYPKMVSAITKFKGSVMYYMDDEGTLRVPKRPLKELLHINKI